MNSSILAAILAWLPAIGSGPSGDFILRSDAPEVVLLIGAELNGGKGCFSTITAGGIVWTLNTATGDWGPAGDLCTVTATRRGKWLALHIEFAGKLKGEKTVYLLERGAGPEKWYRAGAWTVRPDEVPWLAPVAPEDCDWLEELFPAVEKVP